ncbi:hypothetical protein JCM10212_004966 [Sporobolomyces blumeae]
MSFGGPGSAFSFAAPSRPARRAGSTASSATGHGGSSTPAATSPTHAGGPAPVDPPAMPSHGSWSNGGATARRADRERESSGGSFGGDHSTANSSPAPRSFSSILSPSLSANGGDGDLLNGAGTGSRDGKRGSKPFVYSRDFLLSLYDDEKAKKRPLELAAHEVATRDLGGDVDHKPWALQDYRDGEKDLFSTSIHPANARPSRMNRTESSLANSTGSNGTLDLSTLGTLPRDRDRALGSPGLRSPSITSGEIGSGRERRTREKSAGPGTMGIMGGVLGGIAPGASVAPISKKKEGEGSKEVWQGGRWRRGAAQEAEDVEKRPSAFGSRRFPLPDDGTGKSNDDSVPDSWDDSAKDDAAPTGSSSLNGTAVHSPADSIPNETDLTASVLGSLALDSDPLEDPLLSNKPIGSGSATPSRGAPPPGLAPVVQPQVDWQYRDPSGQIQGPFSATMMHDWYRQQFFQPDLRVKRTNDADFETLADLIRRTGDAEKPFLATRPAAPVGGAAPGSTFSSAPGTPQLSSAWGAPRTQTPLEQLTGSVGQGRFGAAGGAASPFYEPFGSNAGSPAVQSQTLPQLLAGRGASTPGGSALDPWGASLPSAASPAFQQLFPQQNVAQSPLLQHGIPSVDVLRQLAAHQQAQQSPSFAPQYAGQIPGMDVFGRPSPVPAPSYFDPRQLVHGSPAQQPPTAWIGQQLAQHQVPHQQLHQLQQQQPIQQQQQPAQPWSNSNIGAPSEQTASSLPDAQLPSPSPVPQPAAAAPAVPSPIGPPSVKTDTIPAPAEPVKVEVNEAVVVANEPHVAPEAIAVVEEVVVAPAEPVKETKTALKKKAKEAKLAAAAAAAVAAAAEPTPAPVPVVEAQPSAPTSPSPTPSATSSKAPSAAPWATAKDDASSPSTGPSGTGASAAAPSLSLREIQLAEAREADKRKAAARIQAAQASIQAAQRAAAAEAALAAEQLPSTANWAAGPAQVPTPKSATSTTAAPWTKPAATTTVKAGGKTLKEIQEEEEKRKAAQAQAQQASQAPGFVGKGYAGSAAKATSNPSAPWTTVAVKPAVVHAAPATKSIIPGLPSAGSVVVPAARPAVSTTSSSPATATKAAPAARPAVASTPSASAVARPSSIIRSVNVNGASSNTSSGPVYDAENPPPPSAEFVAWIRQALKGLQVPMDEFIQVLLSFPLDASSDVLEIISDSVYANSSTLDGRRFANDFATRRKADVAARYPQIISRSKLAKVGGAPVSMAQALASQPQAKPQEWSVKVSGGKKKKGAK